MKYSKMFQMPTKEEMLADFDSLLTRFYGAETRCSPLVRRLPYVTLTSLHEIYRLNRDEPIAEQVRIFEAWVENFL